MKRPLVIAIGTAFVGAAVVLLLGPWSGERAASDEGGARPAAGAEARRADDAPAAKGTRRSVLPRRLATETGRGEAGEGEGSAPERLGGTSRIDAAEDPSALIGLGVRGMDDGLREKLKVPDDSQIGYGVVVTDIHPDSPAAEIFMRPNDVIVRADLKKVDSPEDLETLVGARDHTLLTVSRDGALVQMVLKKPFRKNPEK